MAFLLVIGPKARRKHSYIERFVRPLARATWMPFVGFSRRVLYCKQTTMSRFVKHVRGAIWMSSAISMEMA